MTDSPTIQVERLYAHFKRLTFGDATAAAVLTFASVAVAARVPIDPSFLSIRQVAEYLGVSEGTVRNLVTSGKLPASRVGKGRGVLRIDPADVKQFQRASAGSTMPLRRRDPS